MIRKEEVYQVGQTNKTHGIKGELSITFTKENFDESNMAYYIFKIDGIFVPFFVDSFRFKSNSSALISFEGIDNEEEARILTNQELYIHQRFVLESETDDEQLEDLIGYTIKDTNLGDIGITSEIDNTTENILFIIKNGDKEILIPLANEFIVDIIPSSKTIQMNLPEGLVNMDLAEVE